MVLLGAVQWACRRLQPRWPRRALRVEGARDGEGAAVCLPLFAVVRLYQHSPDMRTWCFGVCSQVRHCTGLYGVAWGCMGCMGLHGAAFLLAPCAPMWVPGMGSSAGRVPSAGTEGREDPACSWAQAPARRELLGAGLAGLRLTQRTWGSPVKGLGFRVWGLGRVEGSCWCLAIWCRYHANKDIFDICHSRLTCKTSCLRMCAVVGRSSSVRVF